MKRIFFVLSLSIALAGGLPLRANAQFAKNTMCPVMPGDRVKEKFFVDYQGERIYLCCRNCVKAFKRHPERYLKNLAPAPPIAERERV